MSQDAWDFRGAPTDATGPRPCGWALVTRRGIQLTELRGRRFGLFVGTNVLSTDRMMVDEWKIDKSHAEEAVRQTQRPRAAFPASKPARTQSIP